MIPRLFTLTLALLLACDAGDEHEHDPTTSTTDTSAGASSEDTGAPAAGVFELEVRPVFDAHCVGCHGAVGAQLGLVLGPSGQIASSEVLGGLISVPATAAPMNLVEPGDPGNSWLLRKLTGDFAGVACTGGCGGPMPPAGAAPTPEQIAAIEAWIAAGAPTGDSP